MTVIEVASTEMLRVPVTARNADTFSDITDSTVSIGFTDDGTVPDTWESASWDADPAHVEIDGELIGCYYASVLIEAGDLTVGEWHAFVRVVDGAETVIQRCGRVTVR